MTDSAQIALADALEAAAFRDLYATAPPSLGASTREIAGATLLIAPKVPVTFFNRVIGLGNARAASERDVEAMGAAYREAGVTSFWVHVSPGAQPDALPEWLKARGYAEPKRRSWAKFARETGATSAATTSLTIRPATSRDAEGVGAVVCAAFGMPASLGPWFAALIGRPGWRLYVACEGPRVVATGALFVNRQGGWLGVGATLEEFRGRGAQSALLAARIAAASAAGCSLVTTETGEPISDEPNPSYDNIQRAGFRRVSSRINYASPG